MAPLWFSSYVLQLRVPDVSLTAENIADFISAYIIGNLLQMAFRFWAFRRWVFPDEFGREPGQGDRVHLHRRRDRRGDSRTRAIRLCTMPRNVTPLRRSTRRRAGGLAQLGDSSEPRVSKTS